jgi:hypothetical protein
MNEAGADSHLAAGGDPTPLERQRSGNHEPALSRKDIAEEAIRTGVQFAQSQIDSLLTSGRTDHVAVLYGGIEGGAVTEATIQRILERLGVDDLRRLEAKQPTGDDEDAEAIYELERADGLILRLTRVRTDTEERLLELEAEHRDKRVS